MLRRTISSQRWHQAGSIPRSFSRRLATHIDRSSQLTVDQSRSYCVNLLQKYDSPSHVFQTFIPPIVRDAYLSIRAFNIELARIPDIVSSPNVGALRMQFWRESLEKTFANAPPQEPITTLLHSALTSLRTRQPDISTTAMRAWFNRIIDTREEYIDDRPYTDLSALETYAENTYSTLMYLTLASFPMTSMPADHLVSHIGKAMGIVAVLRGLPLVAFPPPPNHHSNTLGSQVRQLSGPRQGFVKLPLDVMAETGVKEEDVLRQGAEAPGLRDAVFKVATRANDHLITAREMFTNLQRGEAADHKYEHGNSREHSDLASEETIQPQELKQVFGVLMPAVSTRLWLETLEKHDFDIFNPRLRIRDWRLPWKAYWAYSRKII